MKRCPHCGIEKDESGFAKDKTRKDGLNGWCKQCLNQAKRKWYEENKEYQKEYARKWYIINKEHRKEKMRQWERENPDKRKAIDHKRRAIKKLASGSFTSDDINQLYEYQEHRCEYCGKDISSGYHIDHVKPLNKQGSNDKTNLVLACETCNLQKNDRDLWDWIDYHYKVNGMIYIPTFISKGNIKWRINPKQ